MHEFIELFCGGFLNYTCMDFSMCSRRRVEPCSLWFGGADRSEQVTEQSYSPAHIEGW